MTGRVRKRARAGGCLLSLALIAACQSTDVADDSPVGAPASSALSSSHEPGDPDSPDSEIAIVRVDPPPQIASPSEVLAREQAAAEASRELRSISRWVSRAMTRGTDVVVLGTAVSGPSENARGHTFSLDVDRTLQGSVAGRISVLQRTDTLNECGRLRPVAGHDYILFLSRLGSDTDEFLLPETTGMSSDSNWLVETPKAGVFKFDLGPYATESEISAEIASAATGGTE